MDESTSFFLAKASVVAGLIPATIAILNSNNASWNQRMIFKLVVAALATEVIAYLFSVLTLGNNLFLSHIFILIEFTILTLIYKKELSSFVAPKFFNLLIVLFIIYSIFNSLFIETLTQFNGYARAISGLIIILFTLLYFYKVLKELKVQRLEKEPMLWLSLGLLLYFSASLFIFIFGNYIQPSVKLSFTFWGIHAIINISLCIFYAIALWIKPLKTA